MFKSLLIDSNCIRIYPFNLGFSNMVMDKDYRELKGVEKMLRVIPLAEETKLEKETLNLVKRKAHPTISALGQKELEKLTEIVRGFFPEIKKLSLEEGRLIIFEIYGATTVETCPPGRIVSYNLKEGSGGLKRLINLASKIWLSKEKIIGFMPDELYFHPNLIRDLVQVLYKQSREKEKILLIATYNRYLIDMVNRDDLFFFSQRGLKAIDNKSRSGV